MSATLQLAAALLSQLGFETVGSNTVMARLNSITPSGGTVMRDALLAGVSLILNLNSALMQIGEAERWNFVHILITDGQDSGSKSTLEDAAGAMYLIGQTIPVSRCKTIIIGIDLENSPQAAAELVIVSRIGGENCQIYEIGSVNISDLFNRIQVELGMTRQTGVGLVQTASGQRAVVVAQHDQAVMRVSRTSFAVVFNIDISGSMKGSRYQRVKESVAHFLANTPADDLVAGLCFNSSVMMLKSVEVRTAPASRSAIVAPTPRTATVVPASRPAIAASPSARNAASRRTSSKSGCCCVTF